jgi:uncharacterized membrane protein (Fun14 family)
VIIGLSIAVLAYLEYQRIIQVDWNMLQTVSQNVITWLANAVIHMGADHVGSMVLPHNATGFSDTIKIMPSGSAAGIGRPHIINQTHNASPWSNTTQREHLFIFPP